MGDFLRFKLRMNDFLKVYGLIKKSAGAGERRLIVVDKEILASTPCLL